MKIKCLVIDDEPIAIDIITSYIENIGELELAGTCNNAFEAYSLLQKQKVDLLILDIKMPQLTGLEFIKSLDTKPLIILITAYSEHALESYEYDVVDYLVKPVSLQRFLKAISKVFNRLQLKPNVAESISNKKEESYIYVKSDKKMIRIMLNEILYIEGFGNYVKVITEKKEIVTYQTLNLLEKELTKDGFLRIHKSFIISLKKVESFTNDSVEITKREIPIGNSYKQSVIKFLNRN